MAITDSLLGLAGVGLAIGIVAAVFSATVKAVSSAKNKTGNVFGL